MDAKPQRKVAIVTGANTGIGAVTASELAKKGYHVFLACRSEEKTLPVIKQIKNETKNDDVEFLHLDLFSLKSVRAAADSFLARKLPLQLLVNNAGLAAPTVPLTSEGVETTFATNHLGHFLFTILLTPTIKASTPARIVNVASKAHYAAKGINFDTLHQPYKGNTGFAEYEVSKLANVLFSNSLAAKLEGSGVTSNSLHPGVVASDIWRRIPAFIRWLPLLFMTSVQDGAKTTLHVALAPETEKVTGKYFDSCKETEPSRFAHDVQLQQALWAKSVEWTGVTPGELQACHFA